MDRGNGGIPPNSPPPPAVVVVVVVVVVAGVVVLTYDTVAARLDWAVRSLLCSAAMRPPPKLLPLPLFVVGTAPNVGIMGNPWVESRDRALGLCWLWRLPLSGLRFVPNIGKPLPELPSRLPCRD